MASLDGLRIVDYAASGRPLGVEITAPQAVPLGRLNQLLAELGEPPSRNKTPAPLGRRRPHCVNVFVAGSRQISPLPAAVKTRFDTMIEKGFQITVPNG